MQINTDGKKEWWSDLYEPTAKTFGENTKSAALNSACIHTNQDVDAKSQALEYLSDELPSSKLEEVAEILSTDEMKLTVEVSSTVATSEE